MKKSFSLLILLAMLAALWTLSACSQTVASSRSLSAAALRVQVVTPVPPSPDQSKIGSTDGIFIMGVVIAAISILPALMYRKKP